MAIINNLYVQGASRFLSIIYASGINVSGATSFDGGITTTTLTASGAITTSGTITSTGTVTGNNWFTSTGATGWNNSTYGGGWYQLDSTFLRNYGGKSLLISSSHSAFSDAAPTVGIYMGANRTYYFTQNGILNAYIVSAATVGSNDITTNNLTVTNNIRASKFDLQSVSQLGGAFYVSPTYKNNNNTTLSITNNVETNVLTIVISDSTITSDTIAGVAWTANSKVKLSATIGGNATGTLEGKVTTNPTSGTLTIAIDNYFGPISTGNYTVGSNSGTTFSDLSVMLYERYVNSTYYPVGVWMNCYDTSNNSATIRIYGGNDANPNVMLGNLTSAGLPTVSGSTPQGWGFYAANNAYIKGVIYATSGSVGGFELSNNVIKTAGTNVGDNVSEAVAFSSADFTRTVAGSSRNYLRFAIGANYGIDKDGILYASNAVISGNVSATSGNIGGWVIDPNLIYNYATIADYGGVSGHDVTSRVIVANGTNGQHDFLVVEVNDQGTYTYPFVVHADGELWATNAHITGAVTATSGTFTGTVNANSGTFGGTNGFVIATNKIYSNSKSSATSTNNGIYIGSTEGIYLGAYNSTNTSCPFQVTNAGALKSTSGIIGGWTIGSDTLSSTNSSGNRVVLHNGTNATQDVFVVRTGSEGSYSYPFYVRADGTVHAVKGDIAGWTLNANGLYKSDGTISIANSSTPSSAIPGVSWSHIGMTMKNSAGTITADYGLEEFKIAYSSNYIDCTCYGLLTTGYVKSYKTGDAFAAEVSSASGLQYRIKNSVRNCSMHLNGSGLFGLYDDTNSSWVFYSDTSGNINTSHSFKSGSSGSGGSGAIHVISQTRNIALHANAAGNAGLFDSGNSAWILRSDTQQGVYIPHNTYVSGDYLYLGTTAATNSPNIICANNKNNVALSCTQSSAGVYHHNGSGSSAKWLISITTAGVVTANTSDVRYKNIYGNIDDYEAKTMLGGLDVINFTYKEDTNNVVQNGFKAQQIRDLLKSSGIGFRPYLDIQDVSGEESVTLYDLDAPEDDVIYSVDYSRFTPLLVKGWQIHDNQIATHDDDIASLKEEIAQLREEIAELRAMK